MTAPVQNPWLAIVGIGEDGVEGLIPAARRLISQAAFVWGGKRHLALAAPLIAGRAMPWPTPLAQAPPAIIAQRGARVCVLASGDPFFFGVGSLLAPLTQREDVVCVPSPSAFALAAARLGWSQQDCVLLSLHGRRLELLRARLHPGARLIALTWDSTTPAKVAAYLDSLGMGASRLIVLERMGGARERVRESRASAFKDADVDPLNTLAIEVVADGAARFIPLTSGLPDAFFEHDGQLTKRAVRAATLAQLAPQPGELLWDVGAGSGSIAIEWMLRAPANRAIAIERRSDRAERAARNALALGTPELVVVAEQAPAVFASLPRPHAVFVGGGALTHGMLDAAWSALSEGGRLVVNAVTIETQAELAQRFATLGGELTSLQIAHAERLGPSWTWRPALPIVQWTAIKGGSEK